MNYSQFFLSIIFAFHFTVVKTIASSEATHLPVQSEIIAVENIENGRKYTLQISNDASTQLNSLVIGLPCGKITSIYNSVNWPAEFDVLDKESGIYGFRIINNRNLKTNKIKLTFNIVYQGDYCTNLMETWRPKIAYKSGKNVFRQTLHLTERDIPGDILFDKLESKVRNQNLEVQSYSDPEKGEAIVDLMAHENDQVKLEIYNLSGIKISTMFIGHVKKGIRSLITFSYDVFPDSKYIYKISSSCNELYGRLVFPD